MVITPSELGKDVGQIIQYGQPVLFKYYNSTIGGAGSYYDDDVTLTKSGNDLWVSGLHFPLDATRGSTDSVLVQQGRLLNNDTKLYIDGGVNTSGIFQVGIGGSPPVQQYKIIEDGIIGWGIGGSIVYKKLYLRVLTGGSFIGQ